ncbi:MAG: class I SAM-dependent methyltransferase, partial [Anaerolineae bacterium]|nr:class I SAM-dependent methyltransferase [Anaerolineae bacterium]
MKPSIFQFNQDERDQFVKSWAEALPKGCRVLDVGAGTCRYKSLFDHCHYAAQDFAQYKDENWVYGQLDYICDAAAIPAESGSFDAILCTEVLEHVPEPIRVIAEMARLLRPGGRLLLTAPLGSGLHQEPYHFYGGYTPYWYQKFLAEYGFKDIVVTPNGGFFKHYGQESQRFSTMLDPRRRYRGVLLSLFWLLTLPWFRLALPLLCHWLDKL